MASSDAAAVRLAGWMETHAAWPGWDSSGGLLCWGDIAERVRAYRRRLADAGIAADAAVGLAGPPSVEMLVWLVALGDGGRLTVVSGEPSPALPLGLPIVARVEGDAVVPLAGFAPAVVDPAVRRLRERGHSGLVLRTGGTSGTPKWVLQDWDALVAAVGPAARPPVRILPLMRFDHIGGIDILLRAVAAGDTVVEPPRELTPDGIGATVARHRVEVMPATPTLLNLLLAAEVPRRHDLSSLRVVPHGAEPMPAALRERLAEAFPGVRFVERFGTTETGALPVESHADGLALRADAAGYGWEVRDGELWVRSPSAAVGYLGGEPGGPDEDGWFRTGDAAEVTPGGAIRLRGRRSDLINVGGRKAAPSEVEGVLLAHPQVVECRVYGEPNALLGQVVAAEVVWRGEAAELEIKRALQAFAEGRLERHQVPVVVRRVERVEATAVGKKARREMGGR